LLPFWWSRVLFLTDGSAPNSLLGVSRSLPLLLVLTALLFFSRLGCPLQEPEEPRYAEIPRQMLASGSFTVPTLHGLRYYDQPPLLYWLVMASYTAFGVHDWAARLVQVTAAFCAV